MVHFGVRQSDASSGPIDHAMKPAEPSEATLDAMNHDQAAGIDAFSGGAFAIGGKRIRDTNGPVETTVRILAVEDVTAFRSFVVAGARFRSAWAATERDAVATPFLSISKEQHLALAFE